MLAHHFEDMEQQSQSATLGMWTFLGTEVMFFGGLLGAFVVYRFTDAEAFGIASEHLSVPWGTFNTFVLLTSSLTMALAVRAGQLGKKWDVIWLTIATMVLATCFLGVKVIEYTDKYHSHLMPGVNLSYEHLDIEKHVSKETLDNPGRMTQIEEHTQLFYCFYFFLTGLHAFHMVIGIGVMVWIIWLAHKDRFTPEYYTPLELTGLYWHFVDMVWVFLFPLLYLVHRHT
jgi:cytochrome c oxidase subunit 3